MQIGDEVILTKVSRSEHWCSKIFEGAEGTITEVCLDHVLVKFLGRGSLVKCGYDEIKIKK